MGIADCKTNHLIDELTKRDELSFLTVLALPKASKIGLAWSNCCSSSPYKKRIKSTKHFMSLISNCDVTVTGMS